MKIALTGTHGVGKTSLLDQLSSDTALNVRITPEVPRIITSSLSDNEFFRRGNNTLLKQCMILYGQVVMENSEKHTLTICDRTVLDHWAYTRCLFENEFPEYLETIFHDLTTAHIKTYDQIFYIPIEFEVEDDGTREGDLKFQREIDSEILRLLKEYSVPYIKITGQIENRLNQIKSKLTPNEKFSN